jgi:hypothetical protein
MRRFSTANTHNAAKEFGAKVQAVSHREFTITLM